MGAKQSAEMTKALELIVAKGMSAAEASRRTGISRSAISQNAEYRKHIGVDDARTTEGAAKVAKKQQATRNKNERVKNASRKTA